VEAVKFWRKRKRFDKISWKRKRPTLSGAGSGSKNILLLSHPCITKTSKVLGVLFDSSEFRYSFINWGLQRQRRDLFGLSQAATYCYQSNHSKVHLPYHCHWFSFDPTSSPSTELAGYHVVKLSELAGYHMVTDFIISCFLSRLHTSLPIQFHSFPFLLVYSMFVSMS